jgi:heme exporter protein CcmD
MDFHTFASMGGYALYVWGAYGIGVVAYGAVLVHALMRLERLKKLDPKK